MYDESVPQTLPVIPILYKEFTYFDNQGIWVKFREELDIPSTLPPSYLSIREWCYSLIISVSKLENCLAIYQTRRSVDMIKYRTKLNFYDP